MAEKVTAKGSSLVAQIIAAVWIAGWCGWKFFTNPGGIDVTDVLLSGVGIAACFMPVYFSIIMDKIRDIKIGKAE
jgi:hypothetical protein